VEATGLPPELHASISPAIVDLIVSGPLPVLDTLTSQSFRAVVDLSGMEQGTYQLEPTVDLVPDQVEVQSVLPQTVEVTIETAPTATPTQPLTSSNSLSAASKASKASATPQP
jgi:YbbR domain-containing protein